MITIRHIGVVCAGWLLTLITSASQASLIGILPASPGGTDYQAYYDNVANLTWLANANGNGAMTWANATAWVASLDIDGVTGWRLPEIVQPDASCSIQDTNDSGFNCTGSEMGNLFYNVLGGSAGSSITTSHNGEYDKFSNVQNYYYWSSTVFDGTSSWSFDLRDGYQDWNGTQNAMYAWAVQTGNVAPVPVPAAIWQFGGGLLGLIGVARQRRC